LTSPTFIHHPQSVSKSTTTTTTTTTTAKTTKVDSAQTIPPQFQIRRYNLQTIFMTSSFSIHDQFRKFVCQHG